MLSVRVSSEHNGVTLFTSQRPVLECPELPVTTVSGTYKEALLHVKMWPALSNEMEFLKCCTILLQEKTASHCHCDVQKLPSGL